MEKMKITQRDYIKAYRRAGREAEIENHTHPISFKRVHKSKKVYDRKRCKAENSKALPYFFIVSSPIILPHHKSAQTNELLKQQTNASSKALKLAFIKN